MQDRWYGDNRDLIKWGVLLRLAETFGVQRIVQVACYQPSEFARIKIDGEEQDLPAEVISHFRDLRAIGSISTRVRVAVFDQIFEHGDAYCQAVLSELGKFARERCIVFLDPDTGLEPRKSRSLKHVREDQARKIWDAMKEGDVFVFYQHQTNRAGKEWKGPKRAQLAQALDVQADVIRLAEAPKIASDVVFFFARKRGEKSRS